MMTYRLIPVVVILSLLGCDEREDSEKRESAKVEAPSPNDVEQFVNYVVFKEPCIAEDRELFHVRANWNESQQERSVEAAIPLLKPIYADHVIQRAMTFVAMERNDGYPAFRRWLRNFEYGDSEPRLKLLLAVFQSDSSTLPEWFDIWQSMASLGGSGPYVRFGVMNRTYPAIDWLRSDEAGQNLWTGFFQVMEEAKTWRGFSTRNDVVELQAEWRTAMPKWLKEHPEARSYWIQNYYKSLRNGYSGNKQHWPKNAARMKKAMEKYEREFKDELADRRGICARFLDQ